jgi:uncharacterized membrane protein YvbJ
MIKRCPYCGTKVQPDDHTCNECGKSFGPTSESSDDRGLTNLDAWQEKRIPAWLMYSIVGLAVLCIILMAIEGCNK